MESTLSHFLVDFSLETMKVRKQWKIVNQKLEHDEIRNVKKEKRKKTVYPKFYTWQKYCLRRKYCCEHIYFTRKAKGHSSN